MYRSLAPALQERALKELEAVETEGLKDPDVVVGLALVLQSRDSERAAHYARQALETSDVDAKVQIVARTILAHDSIKMRDFESARNTLEALVRQRRVADDWRLLGAAYLEVNQPAQAIDAFQHALLIRPFRPNIHGL